jgi:hypothetical protein
MKVVLIKLGHTHDFLMRYNVREVMIRTGQLNIQQARQAQETIIRASLLEGIDLDRPMKLEVLQNEITQGVIAAIIEVPVELNDSQKTQFSNDWSTFREHNVNLIKH